MGEGTILNITRLGDVVLIDLSNGESNRQIDMTTDSWDPAHFDQILKQRAVDGAVEAGLEAIKSEYAKSNRHLSPEAEQRLRLTIATRLRGNIKRKSLIQDDN